MGTRFKLTPWMVAAYIGTAAATSLVISDSRRMAEEYGVPLLKAAFLIPQWQMELHRDRTAPLLGERMLALTRSEALFGASLLVPVLVLAAAVLWLYGPALPFILRRTEYRRPLPAPGEGGEVRMPSANTVLSEVFTVLREAMVPYVRRGLQARFGPSWWGAGVEPALRAAPDADAYLRRGLQEAGFGSLDTYALLCVMLYNWNEAFAQLGNFTHAHATELCGYAYHWGKGNPDVLDPWHVHRIVDTARALLSEIGDEGRAHHLASILGTLREPSTAEDRDGHRLQLEGPQKLGPGHEEYPRWQDRPPEQTRVPEGGPGTPILVEEGYLGRHEAAREVDVVDWSKVVLNKNEWEELQALQNILADPEGYRRTWGQEPPLGVILYGPPGTGKTLIARALAGSAKYHFMAVSPAETRRMWVGESAKAIASIYAEARKRAPCLLFFDEIDAVAPRRSTGFDPGGGGREENSAVNQLLQEIEGVYRQRRIVFTVGATNRLDAVDPALLSRLSYHIQISLPGPQARRRLLEMYMTYRVEGVDRDRLLDDLVERTHGFSGRQIRDLCRAATLYPLAERRNYCIPSDFDRAFERIHQTDSQEMIQ